jgi:purine-binding chemotaxis protein CheW
MKKTTPQWRLPPEEVLAFLLGSEEYGIDMQKVQEIRGLDCLPQDAQALDLDHGIVNLHGTLVPVIDMRVRFALGKAVYDDSTSLIVVNIGGRVMSMVVDGISDVHKLDAGEVKPARRGKHAPLADFLIGLGTFGQHKITLIAVDELMSATAG